MPTVEDIAVKLQKLAETTHTNVIIEDFTVGGVSLSSLLNSRFLPYLAPEDFLSGTDLSAPSTPKGLQYTAAALLFQELTSQYYLVLAPGRSPNELEAGELRDLLKAYPPIPRQLGKLNASVIPVFSRALSLNPSRRFESLDNMAENLWQRLPYDPSVEENQLQAHITDNLRLFSEGLTEFDDSSTGFPQELSSVEFEQNCIPKLASLEKLQEKIANDLNSLEQIRSAVVHPLAKTRLTEQIGAARQSLKTYQRQYNDFIGSTNQVLKNKRANEAALLRSQEEERRRVQEELEQQHKLEEALKQKQLEEADRKSREWSTKVDQVYQIQLILTHQITSNLSELREAVTGTPPEELTASYLRQYYFARLDRIAQQLAKTDKFFSDYKNLQDQTQQDAEKSQVQNLLDELKEYLKDAHKEYELFVQQSKIQVSEREASEFANAEALQKLNEDPTEQARFGFERPRKQSEESERERESQQAAPAINAPLIKNTLGLRSKKSGKRSFVLAGIGAASFIVIAAFIFIFTASNNSTRADTVAQSSQTATTHSLTATPVFASTATIAPVTTPVPTATATPTISPTNTPAPTVTATTTPTPSPSPSPTVQSTPGPKLAVLGAGTSRRGDTEKVEPADATSEFKVGDDVYGYINFGDGRPNLDQVEITLLVNGVSQQTKTVAITKELGFIIFPLGKLGAGSYKMEVRYNGNVVANQPEFKVTVLVPTATPIPPTTTSRPQPTATSKPVVSQPTSTPKPQSTAVPKPQPTATPLPQPTATPKPQPTNPPSGRPTCSPGTC